MQVREQQSQEANEAQVAELKDAVKGAQEEAADLHARLATVVPRAQLTAAEQRIKASACLLLCFTSMHDIQQYLLRPLLC